MSSTDIAGLTPEQILKDVIDPHLDAYSAFLRTQDGEGLAPFEREMLRGFLYWDLKGPPSS